MTTATRFLFALLSTAAAAQPDPSAIPPEPTPRVIIERVVASETSAGAIDLKNASSSPVPLRGIIIETASGEWTIPSASPELQLAPWTSLTVLIDGDPASAEPGVLIEPAGEGLAPLNPASDFIALRAHAHNPVIFEYVQWGEHGQRLEAEAVGSHIWPDGDLLPAFEPDGMLFHGAYTTGASGWTAYPE